MEDKIKIIVEAEVQKAIANLQRAQKEARNTAQNFQKSAKSTGAIKKEFMGLSSAAGAIGLSFGAAGAALGVFAKASFDAAASVQASTQVVNRLFQENAVAIRDYAKTTADSLGISEEAALRYSGIYGNLLKGFVTDTDTLEAKTKEMLQQSAVIAAATGRTIEDVNERIRSGLLGNTEAIEDLGINVNVALIETTNAFKRFAGDKSWEQLDFNMQQQIRLAAILEQSYEKYGDSINKNVISATNQANAVFENFKKAIGDALMPYVEEVLPQIKEGMQIFTESDENMNKIIGGIQIVIESFRVLYNAGQMLNDMQKTLLKGFATGLAKFVTAPIIKLLDLLSKISIPGIDLSGLKTAADNIRAFNDLMVEDTKDTAAGIKQNFDEMMQGVSNIIDIANGNIRKSATDTETIVKQTIQNVPKAPEVVDQKWLDKQRDILLQFEIDYRETMGRMEEAAVLSINAQKEIYAEAGVDEVRLNQWADMQILRSKTDMLSGIKRGFHDMALESSDYASQIEGVLSNAFSGAEDALTDFVTTGTADFKSFADAILKDIARMAIKMAIIAPLQRAFSGMMNGGAVGSAKVFHSGGMVEAGSSSRSVPMSLFANAPRFHTGGMLGADEVPVIAQKGERILNREETKDYNARRGVNVPVNVVVNNNSNSNVEVNKQENESGGVDIEVLIGDMVAKQMSKKGSTLNKAVQTSSRNDLIKR